VRKVNLMDELSTVEEVMEHLSGAVIDSGERTDEGMHVYLKDGRVLVFIGDFVMGVLVADKRNLQ
jgi:hypothetical protein